MYLTKIQVLINIIALFATNVETFEMEMVELFAGDTININYLNAESTEKFGDIFNGYAAHLIEIEDLAGVERFSIEKKICFPFEDLTSYYYPEIIIDDTKFDRSKIFNNTNRNNLFVIDPDFINDLNLYGVVKVCWMGKTQKVRTPVLHEKDFPIVNNRINYKLLLDKTAVLRFRQENETHYVSSISTGECFLQAFVNSAELCSQTHSENLAENIDVNSFIISSRYESCVKTTSSIEECDNRINEYMMMNKKSLYHLSNMELAQLFYDKFRSVAKKSVIKLNLKTLPDLPEGRPPPSTSHSEFVADIVPGDVLDVDDMKHIYSVLKTDNFLVDVHDQTTSPFIDMYYGNCFKFNESETIHIKYTPYELHPNHFTESFYKFDVLDEVMKRRNFGVDQKYLNESYKCLKVKICSEFQRTKLIIPSVHVVTLDETQIYKSHIFEGLNVVLRYRLGNETHYVARTEKGNCLFQALIYENLDDSSHNQNIQRPLLFRGKILSANSDQNLEEWAEKFVNDLPTENHKTLMELMNNRTAKSNVYSKFSRESYSNTMINVYLDRLN